MIEHDYKNTYISFFAFIFLNSLHFSGGRRKGKEEKRKERGGKYDNKLSSFLYDKGNLEY